MAAGKSKLEFSANHIEVSNAAELIRQGVEGALRAAVPEHCPAVADAQPLAERLERAARSRERATTGLAAAAASGQPAQLRFAIAQALGAGLLAGGPPISGAVAQL